MKRSVLALLVLLLPVAAPGQGQAPLPPPRDGVAPAIPGVVAAGTRIELVTYPVQGTEGPVGLPDGSGIIFTETRADHITKVDASGKTSTFVEKSNGSNGLDFDARGRLISVQRAPGNEKVGVLYPPGNEATLVDKFEGKPFNRLNDLVVSSKGGVYFTDTPDGTLTNRRNFGTYKSLTVPGHKDPLLAEDNGADGIAIDSEGRVYVATNLGVEVFSPRGQHLGVIPIGIWGGDQFMLRKPQNLAFSGPDKKTLYTVGANAVFRVQLIAQGVQGRAK